MEHTTSDPRLAQAVSVQVMRDSDAFTIASGTPSRVLMYRAAQGVFEAADWDGKRVAIVCGSGNNGGDGYALAGILARSGVRPQLFCTAPTRSEDGAFYLAQAQQLGLQAQPLQPEERLDSFDILVDCILGTGFTGTPRGVAAQAIRAINAAPGFTISVDINSGLNGDTGEAVLAVRSDLTVSIGFYKRGLFLGRAPELIGRLCNVDIGIVQKTL